MSFQQGDRVRARRVFTDGRRAQWVGTLRSTPTPMDGSAGGHAVCIVTDRGEVVHLHVGSDSYCATELESVGYRVTFTPCHTVDGCRVNGSTEIVGTFGTFGEACAAADRELRRVGALSGPIAEVGRVCGRAAVDADRVLHVVGRGSVAVVGYRVGSSVWSDAQATV